MVTRKPHVLRVHPVVVVRVLVLMVVVKGGSSGSLALKGGLTEPQECVFRGGSRSGVHLAGEGMRVVGSSSG